MTHLFKLLFSLLLIMSLSAQEFTRMDSLRGTITPERSWWDLTYYHLKMNVDIDKRYLSGSNTVQYKVLKEHQILQLEMQEPMRITKVLQDGQALAIRKDGYAHFIKLKKKQNVGDVNRIEVFYKGKPVIPKRPPWDPGITWKKDKNGMDFIASTCQGEGASLWWPCKDHPYDETDSMLISITIPDHLTDVSNGRLRSVEHDKKNKLKTFHWFVSNPINNYGVNINIGDYVHFSEKYEGEKGSLDMDYWVLSYNLEKAKKQFKDAPKMMKAFEHWFGPYPFYEDSYKLVEAPYLGMEHQSSVTYGNGYQNGYLGRDLSQTGWGMKFDFIIIHESGHEWFANNITDIDVADMWLHESFTAYSENIFLDYYYGKEASSDYVIGTRASIRNNGSIIGPYNVNKTGTDIYYKGANVIHTIRQITNDDEKWRQTLRGLNKEFYHQTVKTKQVEDFISKSIDVDLSSFFDQYLRDKRVPTLEYKIVDGVLLYRWSNTIRNFKMPLKIHVNGEEKWIEPKVLSWAKFESDKKVESFKVDRNFYVISHDILGSK